ncbi:MAG: immunity protein [Deltaproteobacteria bacterium]|nr:immunity protein [Deltaproteobacteria bacterium]
MKDINNLMMEAYVEVAAAMAKEQGFKKGEFAQKVWPDSEARVAINRWRNMRTQVKITGKPQGLLVSDANRLALALNKNISYMFILAQELAIKKLAKPEEDKPKRRRGRPRKDE